MSKRQYDNFMLIREMFKKEVENIQELIQIIIPQSEEDKQQFNLFLSMITQINNRMQSANNLADVSDILNFDELENDWEELKETIDYYTFQEKENIGTIISKGEEIMEHEDDEEDIDWSYYEGN